MNYKHIISALLLVALLTTSLSATKKTLEISNEFLKIVVNNTEQDTGRFAIETTGGNPENDLDDFQPLVYGRPIPWTSYTTIQINDVPYLFGGKSKKTERRTKTQLNYGTFINQEVSSNQIISTTQFEKIHVKQILSFHRNPNSRAKDTVKIEYLLTNTDTVKHKVGARIMLDTKLGQNDGAPFRMGTEAITAEKVIQSRSLYDYWQTFDNLSTPNIIAQGTLKYTKTKTPTEIRLVNWGTLSDNPWKFNSVENRSFIREGEFEKDTALALYWRPITLQPGESHSVQTLYGLANLSISPGELSLGLTAPDRKYVTNNQPFLIMAYILNSGGLDAHDTTITFNLPKGFEIIEGQKTTKIGILKAGKTYQLPIRVRLNKAITGKHHITLKVTSQSLDSNTIKRPITLIAAPNLKFEITKPKNKINDDNIFNTVKAKIKNETNLKVENIHASINLGKQLSLPLYETKKKSIKTLYPGQTKVIKWTLKNTSTPFAKEPITVTLKSPVTKTQIKKTHLSNFAKSSELVLTNSLISKKQTPYFYTLVSIQNPKKYKHKRTLIEYNPNHLKYIRHSILKPFNRDESSTISLLKSKKQFIITKLTTNKNKLEPLPAIQLHFKVLKENPDLPKIIK